MLELDVALLCDNISEYERLINYYRNSDIIIEIYDDYRLLAKSKERHDVILVDELYQMEPSYNVCEVLHFKINRPIFMLTKDRDFNNEHRALKCGCSDYIKYPENLEVLTKRMSTRKVTVRPFVIADELIFNDCNILDTRYLCVRRNDHVYHLTRKQYEIILYLVKNINRSVSRDELMSVLWNDKNISSKILDAHIKNIRKNIPCISIDTIKNVGYCITR